MTVDPAILLALLCLVLGLAVGGWCARTQKQWLGFPPFVVAMCVGLAVPSVISFLCVVFGVYLDVAWLTRMGTTLWILASWGLPVLIYTALLALVVLWAHRSGRRAVG